MMISYLAVTVLIVIGLYIMLTQKNLFKFVMGINIVEGAMILLLMTASNEVEGAAPILNIPLEAVVDPLPQALALTAIVINASTTALMLILIIKLVNEYKTLNLNKIDSLFG